MSLIDTQAEIVDAQRETERARKRYMDTVGAGRPDSALKKRYLSLKAALARGVRRVARKDVNRASENFSMREFDCRDKSNVIPGVPPGGLVARVPRAAEPAVRKNCKKFLEPMRRKFGACTVNSGHRRRDYNRAIGGANRSEHIYDDSPSTIGTDLKFARGNPREWAAEARRLGAGGVGTYMRSNFVHVDNGPRRDWSG